MLDSAAALTLRPTGGATIFPGKSVCVTVCRVQPAAGTNSVPDDPPGDLSGRSVSVAFSVTPDRSLTWLTERPGLTLPLHPAAACPRHDTDVPAQ